MDERGPRAVGDRHDRKDDDLMSDFTLADLQPGDQVFGPIGGATGGLVGAGEILLAPWKHQLTWRTWWNIRHTATVTRAAVDMNGETGQGPMVAQAEPHGMEEIEIGLEHWTDEWIYIRPRWTDEMQGAHVAAIAKMMTIKKIPYGTADYAAIAAHRVHLPVPRLDHFIAAVARDGYPKRAICSQANDFQLTKAGGLDGNGHVFDDRRLPQDVVPSELFLRLIDLRPEILVHPTVKTIYNPDGAKLSDTTREELL